MIACRHKAEAEKVMLALEERLAKYGLKLNRDKSKLVAFSKKEARKGVKQGGVDFLGFTFYLGKSRKGVTMPKLKSNGKRIRAKLKKVNQWAREMRNKVELGDMWKACCAKLRGHILYYGVSYNYEHVSIFCDRVERIMFKWINRRSQKKSMSWDEFALFKRLFPLPKPFVHIKLF